MANPQKENGFTAIANEIIEQILKTQLTATQIKIILTCWRYTYGFSRKETELSETFISKATGISKRFIAKELKTLIDRKILFIVKESTFRTSRVIAFNKNYELWLTCRTTVPLSNHSPPDEFQSDTTVELQFNTPVEPEFYSPDELQFIQERKYKESIKKAITATENLCQLDNDKAFDEIKDHYINCTGRLPTSKDYVAITEVLNRPIAVPTDYKLRVQLIKQVMDRKSAGKKDSEFDRIKSFSYFREAIFEEFRKHEAKVRGEGTGGHTKRDNVPTEEIDGIGIVL